MSQQHFEHQQSFLSKILAFYHHGVCLLAQGKTKIVTRTWKLHKAVAT